jgi:hypothetical protein
MFSHDIVSTDKFLDMPMSAQALYFHLGMSSDDDGFVSPQKVIRMVGANPDDLKVLLSKGFLIPFETGVIVIRHWRQNNYLQKDRYKPTIYQKELNSLLCIQSVYELDTQQASIARVVSKQAIGESSKEEIREREQLERVYDTDRGKIVEKFKINI